ncbi:uncharacterized protein ColSpa_03986 [Colletotrichum spaethianum]|uniref:Uncharacterized protein n=1 Tax=Colletotrichum spaethianum TaxID=700344 RepID=A0AA37NYV8_9PEZI|nr:uncharacterized protein ColSpa_03986 [Colletotrichum spaethianum]GKT43805.1 hypothetical protein ColSpa_03986 [Colletotrichum spaethianum]
MRYTPGCLAAEAAEAAGVPYLACMAPVGVDERMGSWQWALALWTLALGPWPSGPVDRSPSMVARFPPRLALPCPVPVRLMDELESSKSKGGPRRRRRQKERKHGQLNTGTRHTPGTPHWLAKTGELASGRNLGGSPVVAAWQLA